MKEKIKVPGCRGTWIIENKLAIKDMNGKSRTIAIAYHSSGCDDIPPIFLHKGKLVEELEGFEVLEDVIEDMQYNEWEEI